ncbi:hypothetical protein EAS17NKHM_003930 [Enterobacter asburiae]|jgi:hypothetical protein|nr:hypothetical protein EAS17NKHM_003930 [Enterobacter asburiae]
MSLSSRLWRIFEGLFDRWYSGAIHKKSPRAGGNVNYGYVLVVGFPGASVKALSVNICTGVHVAVAAGLTG